MPRDQSTQVAGLVRQDIELGAELRALGSSLVKDVLASPGSDPLDESVRLVIGHAPLVRRQELVLPSANSCFQGMRWPTCSVAGGSTIHPTGGYRTGILKALASIRFALFSFGKANRSLAPQCTG